MNNDDMNRFVENYATKDKTNTAMMLTGEWGSGKSYYIKNSLCPFLREKGVKCLVVSLYGVDNVSDLSKSIYLNYRIPRIHEKSEVKEYAAIIGNNLINCFLSFKGINASVSRHQLNKLYKSINLENVLIVLEDLERSSIDVVTLLGFINGLVEYDGAKVLVVANEDEIQNSRQICNDTLTAEESDMSSVTGYVSDYNRIKEKTIGDTLRFRCDIRETIMSVLSKYSGEWIQALTCEREIERLSDIVINTCNRNLRILIYAVQKYHNIFEQISENFEEKFYKASFEGILILSSKMIGSKTIIWDGSGCISMKLGSPQSPVFKFAYDYLKWNVVITKNVTNAAEEYSKYLFFEKDAENIIDDDITIINNFYVEREKRVFSALENIEKKTANPGFIGINYYEKLGYLVIRAGSIVGYDTSTICKNMINNANKMCRIQNVIPQEIVWGIYGSESDSEIVKTQYRCFVKDLTKAIEPLDFDESFSYTPDDIHVLYENIKTDEEKYKIQHKFIGMFDPIKLVSMLEKSNAEQIDVFRRILFVFYRDVSKNEYEYVDCKVMKTLIKCLKELEAGENEWDKIQLLQIDYLISNLEEFVSKME